MLKSSIRQLPTADLRINNAQCLPTFYTAVRFQAWLKTEVLKKEQQNLS